MKCSMNKIYSKKRGMQYATHSGRHLAYVYTREKKIKMGTILAARKNVKIIGQKINYFIL